MAIKPNILFKNLEIIEGLVFLFIGAKNFDIYFLKTQKNTHMHYILVFDAVQIVE